MSTDVKNNWVLIVYKLNSDLSTTEKNDIIRKLYGFKEHSNHNQYKYIRHGLLSNITCFSPVRSIIIINEKYKKRILAFLKKKATAYSFQIKLSKKKLDILKQLPKKGV